MARGEKSFKTLLTKKDMSFFSPTCWVVEEWKGGKNMSIWSLALQPRKNPSLLPSLSGPWEGRGLTAGAGEQKGIGLERNHRHVTKAKAIGIYHRAGLSRHKEL